MFHAAIAVTAQISTWSCLKLFKRKKERNQIPDRANCCNSTATCTTGILGRNKAPQLGRWMLLAQPTIPSLPMVRYILVPQKCRVFIQNTFSKFSSPTFSQQPQVLEGELKDCKDSKEQKQTGLGFLLLLRNPTEVKINTSYYQSNYFIQVAFIHKPDQLKMHQKNHQKELMDCEEKSKRRWGSTA